MSDIQNKTITMCVIDDIESIVEGISTQIDWERHGITVIGTAINGEDGLSLIRARRPDIILTDIRMPKMDGLEMARIVREELPDSKVLLLTGYTDFHYAQQAVGMGVFDFVTKPFSLEQIEEAVLRAQRAVEERRLQELKLQSLEQQAKESIRMKRQHYLNLIVRHKADQASALAQWQSLQIEMDSEHFAIALLEIDQLDEDSVNVPVREAELTDLILHNIVEETISYYTRGIVFKETADRFVAIFNTVPDKLAKDIAEECCTNMSRYAKFTVSVGLGKEVRHIHELSQSYEQAVIALSYRFYTGGNAVCAYEDISTKSVLPGFARELEQELLLAVGCGNGKRALAALDGIFAGMLSTQPLPDPEHFRNVCYEIAFLMLRTFHEKMEEDEFASIPSHLRDNLTAGTASYKELQHHLRELCELGCALIENKHRTETARAIDDAIRYIGDHLHMELTVGHCAKQVHLSASYFAAMFKKTTGITFNGYLNRERMERAKKMLLEDKQIQEVAESLGYEERRYFSNVFKKNTGLTPSEFKQKYWQEETSQ